MKPFTTTIDTQSGLLEGAHNHLHRRLSSMKGQYSDPAAYEALLRQGDVVVYEVYENVKMPPTPGDLYHGTSIVHPGRVGDEFFMTKGHFHQVLDTAEVYYCVRGHGYMLMETPEGQWAAEELKPGVVLYVPPRWAHRSVNTGPHDLITFFVYPGDAGHDYGAIEVRGFRKLLVDRTGEPTLIDNPHWSEA